MFVMGNSMGSCGTFHVLSRWPELFRAGAPSGTMPLTEYLDIETLREKPVYYVTGTEDANDPADMYRRCLGLRERGLVMSFHVVGGGYHPDAYVSEMEEMFRFFESFD